MLKQRVLTDADVAAFKRDGFLVKRGLFSPEEMTEIAGWIDECEALPEVPGKYMMYFEESLLDGRSRILNRLENIYPYHAGLQKLFDGDRMMGAVSELLGEPAVLYKDKVNFKLPGGDGFKPHQDQQAGWSTYADFFITALLSIDTATVSNGCLELSAGWHDRGLIGAEWKPLDDELCARLDMQPCETVSGDVVFFDSYAPHGSGPNLTELKRRVLYVTYNAAAAGDHRAQYYADKRASYPPDIERDPAKSYSFKV